MKGFFLFPSLIFPFTLDCLKNDIDCCCDLVFFFCLFFWDPEVLRLLMSFTADTVRLIKMQQSDFFV